MFLGALTCASSGPRALWDASGALQRVLHCSRSRAHPGAYLMALRPHCRRPVPQVAIHNDLLLRRIVSTFASPADPGYSTGLRSWKAFQVFQGPSSEIMEPSGRLLAATSSALGHFPQPLGLSGTSQNVRTCPGKHSSVSGSP